MNTSFNVGDSARNVTGNRQWFLNALGVMPDRLAIPQQQHTAIVKKVSAEGTYEQCDALITNVSKVFLSVSVADCAPVFLFDRKKKVVGCVHAGWRGTEQRIVQKTLLQMQQDFGSAPVDIHAFIGPSAGQCCYEVGEEVARKFDVEFVLRRSGKIYLDIKRANNEQLRVAGVPGLNIEVHVDCTICNLEFYHSYRRDREKSGRMMGIIGLNQ
jgi:YfiH family protein